MVLVATSVWTSYFRDGNPELANLPNNGDVLCNQLIIGELACGNLKDRNLILSSLQLLPMSIEVEHEEDLSALKITV